MSEIGWVIIGVGIALGLAGVLLWRPVRERLRAQELARARNDFHRFRERLECNFFSLAAGSGKPRGLTWANCDFEDDVTYARDRESGELAALVAVAISFEAIAGGDMEHVEAVGNLRAATAVFAFRRGQWTTEGRALFNLNPSEALRYYQGNLELVGQETK